MLDFIKINITAIALVVTAIATVIIAWVEVLKNKPAIKQSLTSLIAKLKIYERRNNRIIKKEHEKAQAILNKKVTRAELINIINTQSEINEQLDSIIIWILCILIQSINDPNNQTLRNFVKARGFDSEYNMKDIEYWVSDLWERHNRFDRGKMVELTKDMKRLKKKIEALKSKTD